jgi:hypothetical protein
MLLETESAAVLEEVPNKKAAVETFRALNKLPAKG